MRRDRRLDVGVEVRVRLCNRVLEVRTRALLVRRDCRLDVGVEVRVRLGQFGMRVTLLRSRDRGLVRRDRRLDVGVEVHVRLGQFGMRVTLDNAASASKSRELSCGRRGRWAEHVIPQAKHRGRRK